MVVPEPVARHVVMPGALGGGAILDVMVVKRFRGLNVASIIFTDIVI